MSKPIEWIIEDLERRRRVPIPLGIAEFKNREKLDRIISNKNVEAITLFFDKSENFDFDGLNFLSQELNEKRNVSVADLSFINNLVAEIKASGNVDSPLSNSVGSFLQVEETFTAISMEKLPKKIIVALLLWSYLTVIESAISDLSEIFYRIALKKDDKKYINLYENLLKRGEHLMFNQLKKAALCWKLIKPQDVTFLTSRNLRNYISHANLYYDSVRDKILLPNREELTFQEFELEYLRVYDFFKELIFKLNDNNTDIKATAEKLRKGLAKEYRKLSRSGATKKLWRSNVKLPWEERK